MFEEILYKHLLECDELTRNLTKFNNIPAVFKQKAPEDMSKSWDADTQYGRVVFFVNMQSDSERKISGTLEIDVHLSDTFVDIEGIGETVKTNVDGYFFSGKSETVFAKWNSTRYVDVADKKVTVVAVLFSLIAFPSQLSSEPDPIKIINNWTRELLPEVRLIGYDTDLPTVWKPTKHSPAVYWRKAKVYPCERVPSTFAGDWYTAQMYAHIFAIDMEVANTLATVMCKNLNIRRALRFGDDTCMRIDNNNQIQPGADELRVGQLSVEGDYCILRQKLNSELLKNIIING